MDRQLPRFFAGGDRLRLGSLLAEALAALRRAYASICPNTSLRAKRLRNGLKADARWEVRHSMSIMPGSWTP